MPVTKPVKKSNKKPVIKKTQDMQQTIEQTDAAIRETFYNMEEGVEYVLNDFWFKEANRTRGTYDYALLKYKRQLSFSRKGDQLFFNDSFVLDFDGQSNIILVLSFLSTVDVTIGLALQHNGIEKIHKDNREGKVVEIDGKKYRLAAV
jgi:hypothetical protein